MLYRTSGSELRQALRTGKNQLGAAEANRLRWRRLVDVTAPAVMQSRPGCLSPAVPDSQHAASGAGLSPSQHSLVLCGRDGTGGIPPTIRGGQQRDGGAGSETRSKQVKPYACPLLSLGCSADGLVEASVALSRH